MQMHEGFLGYGAETNVIQINDCHLDICLFSKLRSGHEALHTKEHNT